MIYNRKRSPVANGPKIAQPGKKTIAQILNYACKMKGVDIFVKDDNYKLSGNELWENILAVAAKLNSIGLNRGDTAVFLCASSVSHAIAMSACLVSGIVACCLHTRETITQNKSNVDFLEAKIILADTELIGDAKKIVNKKKPQEIIDVSEATNTTGTNNFRLPHLSEDDPALILLSSGTTGQPKFILHSQATLAATAQFGPYNYDCWSPTDSTIVIMSPSFAAWIHTVLPFLAIQGKILFSRKFNASLFLKTLEMERLTSAPLVPTAWRMVLAENPERYDLTHLRTAFFSGEPGSESLVRALSEKISPHVMTSYLAAEGGCASGVVAGADILLAQGHATSTGHPIPKGKIKIIEPEGSTTSQLPVGEIGEIALKSASIAISYLGNTTLNREKFISGWWRSGDLGYLDKDGLLFVKGRLDNRINSGGVKVHAEEVEAALLLHPDIQLAAVIGKPDQKWGEKLEAYLVSKNPALTELEISEYCINNDILPAHLVPKAIYFRDTLPIGPTGKLFRRGLNTTQ